MILLIYDLKRYFNLSRMLKTGILRKFNKEISFEVTFSYMDFDILSKVYRIRLLGNPFHNHICIYFSVVDSTGI